ncbi:DUF4252 domain-containing protein [bacterium]|nr:DUF4252 domain-containing protein [bacterium]
MNWKRTMTMAALTALLATGLATASDLDKEPGYLDLEWIKIPADAEEVKDIDLSAMLLSIAAEADEAGDPELAKALTMIKGVRVKAFSLEDEDDETAGTVQKITDKLEKGGWNRLIYSKDGQEVTSVSTKRVDGKMVGLVLVYYSPGDEAAFVNVVGDLDLGTMFRLAQHFDSEEFEAMIEGLDGKAGIEVERTGSR